MFAHTGRRGLFSACILQFRGTAKLVYSSLPQMRRILSLRYSRS
jgi:hypothetical protein